MLASHILDNEIVRNELDQDYGICSIWYALLDNYYIAVNIELIMQIKEL